MDSEHRHELEENALAKWLGETLEERKPQLLLVGVGVIAVVLMTGVLNWRGAAAAKARAEQWEDYARAFDSSQPSLPLLQQAAQANPGTPVQEWSDATWADGRLTQATTLFFRDRASADEAIKDAIDTYENLLQSSDPLISGRSSFQLARAFELQGDLEKAREQYGRVTGAFADLARLRVEELDSPEVIDAYTWITSTSTGTVDPNASTPPQGSLEPDDIPLPEIDAEATLDSLLGEEMESDAAADSTEADDSAEAGEDKVGETDDAASDAASADNAGANTDDTATADPEE